MKENRETDGYELQDPTGSSDDSELEEKAEEIFQDVLGKMGPFPEELVWEWTREGRKIVPNRFAAQSQLQKEEEFKERMVATIEVQTTALDKIFAAVDDASSLLKEYLGDDYSPRGLNEYRDQAYSIAHEKGWHENDTDDFPTKLALMHSEISEALEEYRNGKGYDEVYYNESKPEKPEGISIELADLFIRLMDLCGKYDIDIEKAVETKTAYNKTRPHRHGGKKI